jgi:hypothetical protein
MTEAHLNSILETCKVVDLSLEFVPLCDKALLDLIERGFLCRNFGELSDVNLFFAFRLL